MSQARHPPSKLRGFTRQVKQWSLLLVITLAGLSVLAWLTVLPSAGLLWLVGAI